MVKGVGYSSFQDVPQHSSSSPSEATKKSKHPIGGSLATFFGGFGGKVAATFKSLGKHTNAPQASDNQKPAPNFTALEPDQVLADLEKFLSLPKAATSTTSNAMSLSGAYSKNGSSPDLIDFSEPTSSGGTSVSVGAQARLTENQIKVMLAEVGRSPFASACRPLQADVTIERCFETIARRPEAMKLMTDCGLTTTEVASIALYTSEAYKEINAGLRNGNPSPAVQAFSAEFTRALTKLPIPSNDTLFRNIGKFTDVAVEKKIGDEHQIGSVVTYDAITSTSTTRGTIKGFGERFTFAISPKTDTTGRDVKPFSVHQRENEVTYPPSTRFLVTGRVDSEGSSKIIMEEIT